MAAALPLAPRRTPTPARDDALAFLSGKPYLTTIREFMPAYAFTPMDVAHSAARVPLASASASSSSSSASTSAIKAPWSTPRRSSFASAYSSSGSSTECECESGSSEDEDELATPPVSPDLLPADAHVSKADLKGKGRETAPFSLTQLAVELDDLADDEAGPLAWHPIPVTVAPAPSPSAAAAATPTPAAPLAPRAAFQHQHPVAPDPHGEATPRPPPQPSPPSQPVPEEAARGRSRWPRILWRSELDLESLHVLKDYHERAVGGPLPIVKRGMAPSEVARWSHQLENAGL
ncbi:hypothetical protein Rhopal_002636-T1 [Rhodotorula paludigena]|uniref:Uncharacterized protein n=1 Tax=Rhodotorula paludigena TaxID=86838 RepID=A0AAV5GGF0_9BASI|nr:hypothetical protein Rhopal_002636-T1 [Rhodotorula paludigena]